MWRALMAGVVASELAEGVGVSAFFDSGKGPFHADARLVAPVALRAHIWSLLR